MTNFEKVKQMAYEEFVDFLIEEPFCLPHNDPGINKCRSMNYDCNKCITDYLDEVVVNDRSRNRL